MIELKPSKQLTWLILILYVFTAFAAWCAPLPFRVKGILVSLHGIHAYLTWYYTLSLRLPEAIVAIEYMPRWGWLLRHANGDEYRGKLRLGSLCTRYLALLHFDQMPSREVRYVLIFSDSLSKDDFRRLRKRLWWGL